MIKHKILNELYKVQIIKKGEITKEEASLSFNVLKDKLKCDEAKFLSSLETLQINGDVDVDWKAESALLLRKGVHSLDTEKYDREEKQKIREDRKDKIDKITLLQKYWWILTIIGTVLGYFIAIEIICKC